MTNLFVMIIFFFSNLALSLHTQNHHQTPQTYIDDEYLKGLQLRQSKLNDSMVKIKAQIDNLNKKLQNNTLTTNQQITTLQQGLAEERDALYNVETYMKLPFNLKPCNSSQLTTDQRDSLRNQSKQLNDSLQTLKKQLAACVNCTITTQINQTIISQQNYLQIIGSILDSNCTNVTNPVATQNATGLVDLSSSLYKNNLDAKNWAFGNMTEDQYRLEMFAASIKYNLTSCPIEKPYVNILTNDCFNCPDNLTYNLGKKTCETCPDGSLYNLTLNKCLSICAANQIYNATTKACNAAPENKSLSDSLCPADKPIWNGVNKACEQCPTATPLYDTTQKLCIACAANTTWNADLKQCLSSCPPNNTYNVSAQKCVPQVQCDATKPVLNPTTQQCEACPVNTQWNNSTQKCQVQCAQGSTYNTSTGQCDKAQPQTCDDLKPIWNTTTLTCQICPEATPVWNKTAATCQPCPAVTPVYDYTKFICVERICDPGFKWNKLLMKCSPQTKNCSKEQAYNFANQSCVNKCDANSTYFPTNDTCSCTPSVLVFDPITRKCVEPPCSNNTKWNTVLLKCSPVDMKCQIWQAYNFTQQKCIDKCQVNHTYDSNNDECSCTIDKPMFDPVTRKCLEPACPTGFKWNSDLFKCSPATLNCTKWEKQNLTTEECVNRCEVNQTYFPDNNTCSCPPERPFYDKVVFLACVEPKCPNGSDWNKYKLKCSPLTQKCQIWQDYNFTLQECVNQCEVNHTYFKNNDRCSCTPDAPLFQIKTRKCVIPPCADGSLWNKNLKKCSPLSKNCSDWQAYNFTTELCDKKCDNNATYFNQSDTCQCPPEFPIFNTTTRYCMEPACPTPNLWNKYLLKCSPVKQVCDISQYYDFSSESCITRCQANHTYYKINDTCSCLPEKPQFNMTSRLCEEPQCEVGKKWNVNLKRCTLFNKTCQTWQNFNFNDQTCYNMCEPNQTYFKNNDTCSCVPLTPIFDSKTRKCLQPQCPPNQIWNKTLIQCSLPWSPPSCSDPNMYFDMTASGCICKSGYQYYPVYKSCKPICKLGEFLNTLTMQCQLVKVVPKCGKNMYVNVAGQCVCLGGCVIDQTGSGCRFNCSAGYSYNQVTNSCQIISCQAGFSFSTATNKCEPLIINCPQGSYLNKAKMQCESCPPGFNYNTATNLCETPMNKICPSGYVLNPTTKLCDLQSSNCSSGQYYNNVTQSCMALYITSPQSANLISSNMTVYTQTYVKQKNVNTKLQDCVTPTPFYDKNSKTCVQCTTSQPYFNLDTNKCQDCGSGVYNSTSLSCGPGSKPNYNFDPTIRRFVMNIF